MLLNLSRFADEIGRFCIAKSAVLGRNLARFEGELSHYGVQVVGLFGIGLIETLWSYFEFEVFHVFIDESFALEHLDVLVVYSVVTFLIVNIQQCTYFLVVVYYILK